MKLDTLLIPNPPADSILVRNRETLYEAALADFNGHCPINKLALSAEDLDHMKVWQHYAGARSRLYKASEREDCILIQGSAFVVRGVAFLLLGVGGIDFLDSLSRNPFVDGIIGNGNALFISKDCRNVYSAHSSEEMLRAYEFEAGNSSLSFIEGAPLGSVIFLLRSFKEQREYESTRTKVAPLFFETADTYAGYPVRYSGTLKARLKCKFIATARVVHCARRPSLMLKESLFDSHEEMCSTIGKYNGAFSLVYTKWSQYLCDAIGMNATRQLLPSYNPTDAITPFFLDIADATL